MPKITAAIEQIKLLTDSEISELREHVKTRTLKKGEYFIKDGQSANEIAFIETGMVRSFYITEEGNDITYCVTFENDFITAYSSYISGVPAIESIQAVMDTEISIIQKSYIEKKTEENIGTVKLMRFFAEKYILELEHRVFSYQRENAISRYQHMLKHQPKYINLIPQHYLASYLGITQRHLSRIKKEVEAM